MIEDIIFNLSNNIDIVETNKRIADYKDRNKEFITKNRHRQSKEQLELADMLAQEVMDKDRRQKEMTLEMIQEKEMKEKSKEKLIDDLMFSDTDASQIVEQHKRAKFSTGIDVGPGANNGSKGVIPEFIPSKPYKYESLVHNLEGPDLPEELSKYYSFVRKPEDFEKASGFHESIPCVRALQEAMCGLFYTYN